MSKNYVDVKVTVWQRLHFSDDTDMQKIADTIKDDKGIGNICEDDQGFERVEWLDETEAVLHIDSNDGLSTIEVYSEDKVIWENNKE